jgi:glycosyltransferase involved in cell wall biosynthesis
MKTLLLIPSYAKKNLDDDVAADRHPVMDYNALAAALRSEPGGFVEMLDYASVDEDRSPAVKLARKFGRGAALAVMGFQRRNAFDAIFSNAENIAIPLAALLSTVAERPHHVTIAHRISARKKQPFFRWMKLYRQMDVIFLYSAAQHAFASAQLGIPADVLRLIPFHADTRFYRPMTDVRAHKDQICAAGLEWRDYPTLVDALEDESALKVKLAAASPWSKQANEVDNRSLPTHVSARSYDYFELRTLYAESSFVVVPLYQNDFQAGVTTILEAMAMGKPVVITGTIGQTDIIEDEENGLCVAPGHVDGWRQVIERLRHDDVLRVRLGRAARRWVEEHATLDHWVENIVAGLHGITRSEVPAMEEAEELRSASAAT